MSAAAPRPDHPARPTCLVHPAPRRLRGFSLLEILVALAIAALSLGVLYRATGNNARQIGTLAQQARAMRLAESLLASASLVPPMGIDERASAHGYHWALQSRPYPTPIAGADPRAVPLHEVHALVSWSEGGRERHFELASLRPERPPLPGEVIP